MNFNKVIFTVSLTLFAGLSAGIGSALAFFTKRTNTNFLSVAPDFSGNFMIYVWNYFFICSGNHGIHLA